MGGGLLVCLVLALVVQTSLSIDLELLSLHLGAVWFFATFIRVQRVSMFT